MVKQYIENQKQSESCPSIGRAYRFRMRPKRSEEQSLNRMAGAGRWVWNWALARWRDTYAATGKSISLKQLSAERTALKEQPETAWLKEIDSQALQQVLKDLHRAFTNFFEKPSRYPRFKGKKRDPPAVPHPPARHGQGRQGLRAQDRLGPHLSEPTRRGTSNSAMFRQRRLWPLVCHIGR